MIRINEEAALRLFERDVYANLGEILTLQGENPSRRIYGYTNSGEMSVIQGENSSPKIHGDASLPAVVMLVVSYPYGAWVVVSGYEETLVSECMEEWRESLPTFRLASLDRRVLDRITGDSRFRTQTISCSRSFVCTSANRIPDARSGECRLTREDRDLVLRYPPIESNRPGLPQVFEWYVEQDGGAIYAVRDESELLAYLSCCSQEYAGIWDVEFVHVREDRRRQGLGTQVAALYARETLRSGRIPYYSGARGVASERTALGAGFDLCRELFYTDVNTIDRTPGD